MLRKIHTSYKQPWSNPTGWTSRMEPLSIWSVQPPPDCYIDQSYLAQNGHGGDNTYVVHHNTHIPHMPSELRHTNYGTKAHLVHPQVGEQTQLETVSHGLQFH